MSKLSAEEFKEIVSKLKNQSVFSKSAEVKEAVGKLSLNKAMSNNTQIKWNDENIKISTDKKALGRDIVELIENEANLLAIGNDSITDLGWRGMFFSGLLLGTKQPNLIKKAMQYLSYRDYSHKSEQGLPLLHYVIGNECCMLSNSEKLKTIISMAPVEELEKQDSNGKTPVHLLANLYANWTPDRNTASLVDLLGTVSLSALCVKDDKGRTPLDIAKKRIEEYKQINKNNKNELEVLKAEEQKLAALETELKQAQEKFSAIGKMITSGNLDKNILTTKVEELYKQITKCSMLDDTTREAITDVVGEVKDKVTKMQNDKNAFKEEARFQAQQVIQQNSILKLLSKLPGLKGFIEWCITTPEKEMSKAIDKEIEKAQIKVFGKLHEAKNGPSKPDESPNGPSEQGSARGV